MCNLIAVNILSLFYVAFIWFTKLIFYIIIAFTRFLFEFSICNCRNNQAGLFQGRKYSLTYAPTGHSPSTKPSKKFYVALVSLRCHCDPLLLHFSTSLRRPNAIWYVGRTSDVASRGKNKKFSEGGPDFLSSSFSGGYAAQIP